MFEKIIHHLSTEQKNNKIKVQVKALSFLIKRMDVTPKTAFYFMYYVKMKKSITSFFNY